MTHPRLAPAAGTLDHLAGLAGRCVACPELVRSRSSVVPGVFPPGAGVLLVGEAPGAREDESGVPFIGKAGQLLDTLLAEAGLRRDRVAVTNVVKCRPPRNRVPTSTEVTTCTSWLERQIEIMDPTVLCVLGGTATRWALRRRSVRLGEVRGAVRARDGRPLVVTYHPAAAIRFGPSGRPIAALRADLALVSDLLSRG
ncbi:MAG: uracil-DNA glycosylase [Streptosporangiaceae bacterium]